MADINQMITLGIGTPASIPHFILLGLNPIAAPAAVIPVRATFALVDRSQTFTLAGRTMTFNLAGD